MPILFQPNAGMILVCDYRGSVFPEMQKVRPVVVVSPAFKRRPKLCAVVPLSTTDPDPVENYHLLLTLDPPLPRPFDSSQVWVKADMISTVSHDRLDRLRAGRNAAGQRTYTMRRVSAADLAAINAAMLEGLGLGRLTPHL